MKKLFGIIGVSFLLVGYCHTQNEGEVVLDISVTAYSDLMVTDPVGRITGRDPRSGNGSVEQIPGTHYETDSYDASGENVGTAVVSTVFNSPQEDGIWKIEVIGNELGIVSFSVHATGRHTARNARFSRKMIIDKNEQREFVFKYSAKTEDTISLNSMDNRSPAEIFVNDLIKAKALKKIGNIPFADSLIGTARQISDAAVKNDRIVTQSLAKKMSQRIDEVFHQKRNDHFVINDVFLVLREDLDALIGR